MADDKERAEKLAAARKKAQKKAAEAKAKKGKAANAKEEKPATTETTDESKEDVPADESSTPAAAAESEKEPESAATEPPAQQPEEPSAAAVVSSPPPSESTAALEAKLAELEKEYAEAKSARDEAQMMADALEKKVVSLEMLHKEDESQIKRLESDLAEVKNEKVDLKNQLQKSEAEVLRLSKKEAQDSGGTDNDHLDELEDEERRNLEKRIRELEAENTDLRRGIWQEKRKTLQPGMEEAGGAHFTSVDLGGGGNTSPTSQRKATVFGDFFTSGLNVLTGNPGPNHGHEHDEDGFLDDDEEFDEEAFRQAQEEAAKARIERIKEVKRGLKNWEGWRLDLVDGRAGGGEGIGEVFEV